MNLQEAIAKYNSESSAIKAAGLSFDEGYEPKAYVPDGFGSDYTLAMDAQPALSTAFNAGIPALLTTFIDPAVFKILFAANKAAIIFGENRKGTWVDDTTMFPTVEHTGEVSSYGDFQTSGMAKLNVIWPQRQSYLFQTVKQYGEREIERAGKARISWVNEIDQACATVLNKFSNLTYFFGVAGLQNYGLLNDPNLNASISPATKANGGVLWVKSGVINATANEVFNDIQSLYLQLVSQTDGLIELDSKMTLAMSPTVSVALTATNSFNVNVNDLLKKNFPNIRIETAVQYGALSTTNPQGIAAGNLVQLIADEIEGQDTGYCAFNEKMRQHKIVPDMSSFKQKVTAGTWGAIIRQPAGIASLLGV